jgi:hypothetical protein
MASARWIAVSTFILFTALTLVSCGTDSGGPSLTGTNPPPPPGSSDAQFGMVTTGLNFLSMWGADGELFVCGEKGLILHHDGSKWSMQETPEDFLELNNVFGSAVDDVWAVGQDGVILHYDGTSWSRSPSGATAGLRDVWGASASEAWAVGTGGLILRYTPADGWVKADSPISVNINAIHGTAADNIFAAAEAGTLLYYDGTTWTAEKARPNGISSNLPLRDLWTAPTGECFVAVDGTFMLRRSATGTWSQDDTRQINSLYCVWGVNATDAYAAGLNGQIVHYDGSSWQRQSSQSYGSSLQGGWANAADDVYAAGLDGLIVHNGGSGWSVAIDGRGSRLKTMWGAAANDLHVVAQDGITLHYDGSTVEFNTLPINTDYFDAWGLAPDNIVAVGAVGILHYNGSQWTSAYSGGPLYGVWGSDPDYIVAVGFNGAYIRYDGTQWQSLSLVGTANQNGIWGFDRNTTFIAVDGGKVLEVSGGTIPNSWDNNDTGTDADLLALWGPSADNLFIVGRSGTILHFDGSGFTAMTSGVNATLGTVWGTAGNDVWAAGSGGTVLHYNGSNWNRADIGTSMTVHDVFGFSATEVFLGLDRGTLLELE